MSDRKNSTVNLTRTAGSGYADRYAAGSGTGTVGMTQDFLHPDDGAMVTYVDGTTTNSSVASTKLANEAPGVPVTYINQSYIEFANYAKEKISELTEIASGEADRAKAAENNLLSTQDAMQLSIDSLMAGKQDVLTAGDNVTISGSVISASGGSPYDDTGIRESIDDIKTEIGNIDVLLTTI